MEKVPYSLAIGSLMYAMVSTRPDIAFAVGVVSRYMANLGKKHWEAVKHVLRYLKGSASKCLDFGNIDTSIVGYTDSDYAGCVDTRRSTINYVFLFVGVAVSWRPCLQNCTSSSTTEAEYVAAFSSSKEDVWLSRLVGDLDILQTPMLKCDSQTAIALAKNPMFHSIKTHREAREPKEHPETTDTGKRHLEGAVAEPGAKRPKMTIKLLAPHKELVSVEKNRKTITINDSLDKSLAHDSSSESEQDRIAPATIMVKKDNLQALQKQIVKGKFVMDTAMHAELTYTAPIAKFIPKQEIVQAITDGNAIAMQAGWNTNVHAIAQMMDAQARAP
ncbi:hypothetical protein L7F22_041877 [Adiantum nelumboides]|nr:hypothetical protein [Adiantum nelumboides]